jgi:hypothetical protein
MPRGTSHGHWVIRRGQLYKYKRNIQKSHIYRGKSYPYGEVITSRWSHHQWVESFRGSAMILSLHSEVEGIAGES